MLDFRVDKIFGIHVNASLEKSVCFGNRLAQYFPVGLLEFVVVRLHARLQLFERLGDLSALIGVLRYGAVAPLHGERGEVVYFSELTFVEVLANGIRRLFEFFVFVCEFFLRLFQLADCMCMVLDILTLT